MRFDWYEPTFETDHDTVLEACREIHPSAVLSPAKAGPNYGLAVVVTVDGETAIRVQWGGQNGHPHARATSDWAQPFADLVRRELPSHQVSRADVCQDYNDGPGTFDRMAAQLLGLADDMSIKVRHQGDFHRAEDGRTLYLGAKSSAVSSRLYEKGIQMQAGVPQLFLPTVRAAYPDDMVRLETQVRPQKKAAKQAAAQLSPAEFVGFARWTQALWQAVEGLDVPRVTAGTAWRPKDHDRAYGFMLQQYRAVLDQMRADLGDWACVGLQIGHDLAELDRRS